MRTEGREEEELWTEWCGECTGVVGLTARKRGECEYVAMSAEFPPSRAFVDAHRFKRMVLHLGSGLFVPAIACCHLGNSFMGSSAMT